MTVGLVGAAPNLARRAVTEVAEQTVRRSSTAAAELAEETVERVAAREGVEETTEHIAAPLSRETGTPPLDPRQPLPPEPTPGVTSGTIAGGPSGNPHTRTPPPEPTSPPVEGQIEYGGRPAPTASMPIGGGHAGELPESFRLPEGTYLEFPVGSGQELDELDALLIENTGRIPSHLNRYIYGPGDLVPEHVLDPPGWGLPTTPAGEFATQ